MATKITGIGDDGMPTTTGDTGTLVTDGSLIIGNADTDSVTFNADIASDFKPDVSNTYTLGSPTKTWASVYLDEGIVRQSQTGTGAVTIGFTDPGDTTVQITMPDEDGTLALEGMLPSYLGFGKANTKSAPLGDFELCTVNGSQNAQGYRMPVDGVITHMTCQFDSTAAGNGAGFQVTLWKNGVKEAGVNISLPNLGSGDIGSTVTLEPPFAFAANDRVTLKMSLFATAPATLSVEDVACLLRILN